MPKRFIKFKLLLDENMVPKNQLSKLNAKFDIKHIAQDLKHGGFSDLEVYEFAGKSGRLIVTYNWKDFEKFVDTSSKTGVIGVSTNLPIENVDKKLTALLMKSKKSDLFGKFNYLSGETEN